MEAVALVVVWSLAFEGTHIVLAAPSIRARLVARLGEGGFRLLYSVIATITFTLLVRTYAVNQHVGPLGLGGYVGPTLRWILWGVSGLGATLLVAGLVGYPALPMNLAVSRVPPPSPLARITRHPFFAGIAVMAFAHTFLASHATGTTFFGLLALYTIVGMREQDRKLVVTKGEPYAAYCRETSVMPFAAIVAGRTRLSLREVPLIPLAIGVLGAVGIRWVHPWILAWDGLAMAAATVGFAALVGVAGVVRMALRTGHGPALATAGAFLVLQVGLAHEVVGMRLYPDGPDMVGGPVAWHALGIGGIVAGLAMIGATLGMVTLRSRALATIVMVVGVACVAADAVVHGGFHFFAATLVVGALLVRVAANARPSRVAARG